MEVFAGGGGIEEASPAGWKLARPASVVVAELLPGGRDTGRKERSRAGVLALAAAAALGMAVVLPRVMSVNSAVRPLSSYVICKGRLPREYFAVTWALIDSACDTMARKSLTMVPM